MSDNHSEMERRASQELEARGSGKSDQVMLRNSRGDAETKEGKEYESTDGGDNDDGEGGHLDDLEEPEESLRDRFLKEQEYTYEGLFSTKADRLELINPEDLDLSYRTNSRKEELCLEYVNNFVRQFESLFPERKKLFVAPKNECGVRKFVCTTIRPTQLPFRSLYNLAAAGDFFAHYMQYEPLANPIAPPTHLPSPSYTLGQQVGDSFDLAALLCSYLIGSGYDAYCVYGYASRDVTLLNRTDEVCPLLRGKRFVSTEFDEITLEDLRPPQAQEPTESKEASENDPSTTTAAGESTGEVIIGEENPQGGLSGDVDQGLTTDTAGFAGGEESKLGESETNLNMDESEVSAEGKTSDEALGETGDANGTTADEEKQGGINDEAAAATDAAMSTDDGAGAAATTGAGVASGDVSPEQAKSASIVVEDVDPYKVEASGLRKSKYLQRLEDEQRQIQEAKEASEAGNQYNEEEEEERQWLAKHSKIDADPIQGERMHCWILIRAGKRQMDKTFFLEPTTGKLYNLYGSPYLGVEAVWNNKNYWVNMQTDNEDDPMNISYNLEISQHWEYIFVDGLNQSKNSQSSPETDVEVDLNPEAALDAEEEKQAAEESKEEKEAILDLPPSWVGKLILAREGFRRKYNTTGQRTQLFLKSKLESYAEHLHPHGLVQRLVLFRDRARTMPLEVREYFANRRDKLYCRTRFPLQGRVVEEFAEGRSSGLKTIDEVVGKSRDVLFYKGARLDGLVQRYELMNDKIIERYENRDDHLESRSMRLAPLLDSHGNNGISGSAGGGEYKSSESGAASKHIMTLPRAHQGGDLSILKMKEVFSRNLDFDADEDICKRSFNLVDGTISVIFHYAKGRITRSSRVFYKDVSIPPRIELAATFAKPLRQREVDIELQTNLQAEKDCYQSIRDAERELQDVLSLRKREEANVILDKSIFDTARERAKQQIVKDTELKEEEAKNPLHVDYLTPFLQDIKDFSKISRAEAEAARDACLKSLKERLLERANIIQCRLDEENAQLAKRQAAFQRSRDHVDGADVEFERFCSEAMFRIQILEQRLARHEESALSVYANLDQKLRSDPRLGILFKSN